ncbi:hypothetical protein EBH_0007990 [Eimeria brunetti]|uniref:Transmembrane protein n=1 Tax=Eimeria brunetti TaxID=51314 RepID=U6LTH0_9EIME|nr:hypothetical protein EBH_0007990 [Eimeria brunetti]
MQLASQIRWPHVLEDQRDEVRSNWPANPAGHSGSPKFPYVLGSRRHLSTTVIAAILVVVWALTAAYVCLLPLRMRKLKASNARRLSSNGDDKCQEILESRNTGDKEGELGTSPFSASSEGTGSGKNNKSRRRGRSSTDADEEVEGAKKPLREEKKGIAHIFQSSQGSSSPLVPETSFFQEWTHFTAYRAARGDLLNGAQPSADTEEALEAEKPTATSQTGGLREADWIGSYLDTRPTVEEWFLNHLLDPNSTFSPDIEDELPEDVVLHDHGDGGLTDKQMTANSMGLLEKPNQAGSMGALQLPPVRPSTFVELRFEALPSPSKYQSSLERSEPSTSHTDVVGSWGTLSEHPSYRLPRAVDSQHLAPFDYQKALCHTPLKTLSVVLGPIRELLIKPQLHHDELQSLMDLGGLLVRNVFTLGKFLKEAYMPYQLTEPLARRFVIADTLWCICEVIGPPMMKAYWWDHVMTRLFDIPAFEEGVDLNPDHFVSRLISALKVYVTGGRPGPEQVIELKREIFCSQRSPYLFRSSAFDGWRHDAMC